jgi:ACDE family multidrug resistance protein
VVLAASFSMNLGVQYVSPLLPSIRAGFHLSAPEAGLVVGAYALPSLVMTVPLGVAADLWGAKRLLVASLAVFGAAGVGAATSPTFPALLAWRLLQGAAAAPLASLSISTLADIVPAHRQAMAQGYRSVVASASEFVLPVLAGYSVVASGGWRAALLLLALPLGVAAWGALVLPDVRRPRQRGYAAEVAAASREPAIVAVTFGGFSRWFLKYGFFAYLPLYLAQHLHAPADQIGYVVGIAGLAAALVATQAGRLGLAGHGKAALAASLSAFGLCLPAITLVGSIWWAAGMAVLLGAADGVLGPLLNGFISVLPPPGVRVAVVSLSGLVRNLGKAIAPAAVGPLVLLLGYTGAFALAGLVAIAAPAYLIPLYRRPDQAEGGHLDSAGTGW